MEKTELNSLFRAGTEQGVSVLLPPQVIVSFLCSPIAHAHVAGDLAAATGYDSWYQIHFPRHAAALCASVLSALTASFLLSPPVSPSAPGGHRIL